jgi:hypothetical protein
MRIRERGNSCCMLVWNILFHGNFESAVAGWLPTLTRLIEGFRAKYVSQKLLSQHEENYKP